MAHLLTLLMATTAVLNREIIISLGVNGAITELAGVNGQLSAASPQCIQFLQLGSQLFGSSGASGVAFDIIALAGAANHVLSQAGLAPSLSTVVAAAGHGLGAAGTHMQGPQPVAGAVAETGTGMQQGAMPSAGSRTRAARRAQQVQPLSGMLIQVQHNNADAAMLDAAGTLTALTQGKTHCRLPLSAAALPNAIATLHAGSEPPPKRRPGRPRKNPPQEPPAAGENWSVS